MSATIPGELTATEVIALIESGSCTREVLTNIARGFLPLEQADMIGVLTFLTATADEELAGLARASISEMPPRVLFEYASNERVTADALVRFLVVSSDPMILEALIRNRSLPDAAVVQLAGSAEPRVQDVIVINQARILRTPAILEALSGNPSLSPDVRRRVLETQEEFFVKRAGMALVGGEVETQEEELAELPLDAIADLLEKAEQEAEGEDRTPLPLTEGEKKDPESRAVWTRLSFMTVSEKVQLAYRGDRMVRMLLVRERNKLICSSVMRNPRMSEQEVEAIAGMRNVEEEVLRIISTRRDWMAKYNITFVLCRNPKTPVGVVLPLINRLTLRDLKGLKDDKGVQQVVREMARKLYIARSKKAGG